MMAMVHAEDAIAMQAEVDKKTKLHRERFFVWKITHHCLVGHKAKLSYIFGKKIALNFRPNQRHTWRTTTETVSSCMTEHGRRPWKVLKLD